MIEQLLVRLVGEGSSFSKMIQRANDQTKKFQANINKASAHLGNIGRTATRVGKTITLGLTLPLIGMGTVAVNEFAKFDQAMTQSTSIMDVTSSQIKELRQSALDLAASGEVVQTPREMAQSYFYLASAGLDAAQSMAALPEVAQFATAGAFDMALATDLLTDAQSALGLTVKDVTQNMKNMTRISDVLVKANTLANATVQQFSESLTNDAGAALKVFNKEVEEGVAVLAAYADQGVKGQVAGSQLARVTRLLSKAALDNAEAHRKLGFQVFDARGKMRNYADIIKNLEDITKGMSDETRAATLAQLGFQARVQNAILPLLGTSQAIKDYEAALKNAGGTTENVATKQLASFSNQLKIMKNRATVLAIKFGTALAPAISKLNGLLQKAIGWFSSLDQQTQSVIATTVLATAAIGPLLLVLGKLTIILSNLIPVVTTVVGVLLSVINPVVLVIAAVVGLIAVARYLLGSWAEVGRVFKEVGMLIVDSVVFVLRVQKRLWTAFFGWLLANVGRVFSVDFLKLVLKGLEKMGQAIAKFQEFAIAKIRAVFTGEETGTFADFVGELSKDLGSGFKEKNFLKTIGRIGQEELDRFQRGREGRTILSAEAKQRIGEKIEPIQATIVNAKDNASRAMENVATDTQQMVELLQQQLEKEGLTLEAAGLQK